MALGPLDRRQLISDQEYADALAAGIAEVEIDIAEYRRDFGDEDVPPEWVRDLDELRRSLREAKARAARLSEADSLT